MLKESHTGQPSKKSKARNAVMRMLKESQTRATVEEVQGQKETQGQERCYAHVEREPDQGNRRRSPGPGTLLCAC